jgi:hypothetical protein
MNPRFPVLIGLSLALLASCEKKSSEESQPAPSAVATTEQALDQAPIPVKEDFEAQAEQTITEDNLDEQLSKLEKEIDSDK